MAGSSKSLSRWPRTNRRGRPGFTTGAATRSRSMRLSGSRFEANRFPNWYSDSVKGPNASFWHVLEWVGHIHTSVWIIESLGISGTIAWMTALVMRYLTVHRSEEHTSELQS